MTWKCPVHRVTVHGDHCPKCAKITDSEGLRRLCSGDNCDREATVCIHREGRFNVWKCRGCAISWLLRHDLPGRSST